MGLLLPAALDSCQTLYKFYEQPVLSPHIQHTCNQQAGSGQQGLLCLPKPVYGSVLIYTTYTTVWLDALLEAVILTKHCAGGTNLDTT